MRASAETLARGSFDVDRDESYANIVAATPHLDPGASRVVWIIFAVATLLTAALAVFWLVYR